jgi:hypothetical protein
MAMVPATLLIALQLGNAGTALRRRARGLFAALWPAAVLACLKAAGFAERHGTRK